MSHYWSPIVGKLDPYVPGEQPQDQQYIKLNTNESPHPPSPAVAAALSGFDIDSLKRYPDPESSRLRNTLANYCGLSAEQVFLGNGSDEVLAHAFQALFKKPGKLRFPDISYSFYPVYCRLYEIDFETVPLGDDFSIDVADYSEAGGSIIIPNPNAPTGIALPLDDIRRLLEDHPDSVVIIDEAYVDFGADSATRLIDDFANLLVVQTFSKSRSLAGLRLGAAFGQAPLVEALNRIKNSFNSYPIDSLASACAIASIEDDAYFQRCRERVIASREQLTIALRELGFEVLPSSSNFVLASHPERPAESLYRDLKAAGILVRYFNKPRIDNWLRITVGNDEECDRLVAALMQLLA